MNFWTVTSGSDAITGLVCHTSQHMAGHGGENRRNQAGALRFNGPGFLARQKTKSCANTCSWQEFLVDGFLFQRPELSQSCACFMLCNMSAMSCAFEEMMCDIMC